MMKRKHFFWILFLMICCADVITSATGHPAVHNILKPLIMISLTAYYVTGTLRFQALFVLNLLLCLAGDVFLLYEVVNPIFFIVGLISFLSAHVILIIIYRRNRFAETNDELTGIRRIRLAFPVILAGAGFVVFLYPTLGDLRIPVLLYTTVIVGMVLAALFRYGQTSGKSFWLVFSGGLLFMVSDSILAIDKFSFPIHQATTWIMLTYCAAQYLITEGILAHERQT